MQRLMDALTELEEASIRMPQEIAWQHLRKAMVAVGSVLADMESASIVTIQPVRQEPEPEPDPGVY